jgi:hypothetical protein
VPRLFPNAKNTDLISEPGFETPDCVGRSFRLSQLEDRHCLRIRASAPACRGTRSGRVDGCSCAVTVTVTTTTDMERTNGERYLRYHQLTVEDFPINDSAHPEGAYWVQPFVHYYYHYLTKIAQRGGYVYAYIMDWTVFSGFDKNLSSRKSRFREMNAELPFAQAILDISELHARRFAALKPGELPSGDGRTRAEARQKLQSRLDAFYQAEVLEVQKEVDAFVTATNRGQDKKKVGELSAEIRKRLAETLPAPTALPTASPSPQTTAAPTAAAGASP